MRFVILEYRKILLRNDQVANWIYSSPYSESGRVFTSHTNPEKSQVNRCVGGVCRYVYVCTCALTQARLSAV